VLLVTLGQLEVLLLCLLTLCLVVMRTPVPRRLAYPAALLLVVEALAVGAMRRAVLADPPDPGIDTAAEAVGVLAVPAFCAALLTVVVWHVARAYARAWNRARADPREDVRA